MKLHIFRLGEGKRDLKMWKLQMAWNIKTLSVYFYFIGVVLSLGKLDIISIFDAKKKEDTAIKEFYANSNRHQRRAFLASIKKMKNV